MTKVYLAGQFARKHELAVKADDLEAHGITCTSRWLRGDHDAAPEGQDQDEWMQQNGDEDLEDIDASDLLVLFCEAESAGYLTGGRHVEMGWAMRGGKDILLVGPIENVFHYGKERVETWAQARAWIVRYALDKAACAHRIGHRTELVISAERSPSVEDIVQAERIARALPGGH